MTVGVSTVVIEREGDEIYLRQYSTTLGSVSSQTR
jgi:hypothetical protein